MNDLYVVIMAGGSGDRLWPVSSDRYPKQFQRLPFLDRTLFELTVERAQLLTSLENIVVVTNKDYEQFVISLCPLLQKDNIILEPLAKNTAACIALSSLFILQKNENAIIIVLPSDHYIANNQNLVMNLMDGVSLARKYRKLITLGIKPTRAETGYGYIQLGEKLDENELPVAYTIARFIEKPSEENANLLYRDDKVLWNSGMFVWHVRDIVQGFQKYLPELYCKLESIMQKPISTKILETTLLDVYLSITSISIDEGIMEKQNDAIVLPVELDWDDLGNWAAFHRIFSENPNDTLSYGDIFQQSNESTLIVNLTNQLVVARGLESFVVVNTPEILLLIPKAESQQIKKLVQIMKTR